MQELPSFDKQRYMPVSEGKDALWAFVDHYVPPNYNDFNGYGQYATTKQQEF